MKYIKAILLLFFIFLIFYYIFNRNKIEIKTLKNVHFMKKEETIKFLNEDEDKYLQNMSVADLYARKVKNIQEYKEIISNDCVDFSNVEKQKLQRCSNKADEFLKNHKYKNFDCYEVSKMNWIFAKTGNKYEQGFPHTRKNVIFLSNNTINKNIASDMDDENLTSTLIHEKIHIYQRKESNIMNAFLQSNGYKKIKYHPENRRSNPDINNDVYINPLTGKIMCIQYSSLRPNNIMDIKDTSKLYGEEHPYEKMAYDISNDYLKLYLNNFKNI